MELGPKDRRSCSVSRPTATIRGFGWGASGDIFKNINHLCVNAIQYLTAGIDASDRRGSLVRAPAGQSPPEHVLISYTVEALGREALCPPQR